MKTLLRFWKDEQGLELSEYAVMTALVIVVAVASVILVGEAIDSRFNELAGHIGTAE
ncbi:MAG: Flp family type IVb pilin [Planctomycetes bacterium]|nr:Flp family type IVb pilin [Planctomycetota bacterium]